VKPEELGLDPELLYTFVFGPGFGESIVVRVPPDQWLVVDSLRRQTRSEDVNPAVGLLTKHKARASAVALTHPHEDHGQGLLHILERRLPNTPVGCLDPTMRIPRRNSEPDATRVLDQASLAAGLKRIQRIWATEPGSKWELLANSSCRMGAATVEVLHPASPPQTQPRDLNRISSPMLISWNRCRILLGADLPRPGWSAVGRSRAAAHELAGAHVLRASHHGAKGAQHPVAIGGGPPRDRPCIVTPFNRGRGLPSYADTHGIDQLLTTHTKVGVTAVPPHARQTTTRRSAMAPTLEAFGADLTLSYEDAPVAVTSAWIATAHDVDGTCQGQWSGDSTGTVVTG
jgi:hypothetical protein